jgi:hypothetical protein
MAHDYSFAPFALYLCWGEKLMAAHETRGFPAFYCTLLDIGFLQVKTLVSLKEKSFGHI